MTLQQLKYFCVMAKTLHYTKSAKLLYISQPSLSHSLSGIEKELGVPLFEKIGKKTFLTKYGEEFLPYAQNAIKSISDGEEAVEKLSQLNRGVINIGYIYSVGSKLVSKLVEKFYATPSNKNINFNFTENISPVLFSQLLEGKLDFIFTSSSDNNTLKHIPIFEQQLFLIVSDSHKFSKKSSILLNEINEENFISISHNTSLRPLIDGFLKDENIVPKIVAEADKCNIMASLAEANVGITIMPIVPSLKSYKVRTIPISNIKITREICLIHRKNAIMKPQSQYFKDFVIKNVKA